ncbi:Hypothetical protein SRAE_0000052100 [Strongyloides ratti]|uniref:Uncharacterized protein n=1 Tax=Strongyloides ratti TaxID=34506 RepID=A0A090KZU2_STRRB|nr:Hypothetical protein SRAE_0000052100 [Strongyloides ratti]CEF61397.1 Hypothetical protein SRAE_0000052100 [Strongyloides ratti]
MYSRVNIVNMSEKLKLKNLKKPKTCSPPGATRTCGQFTASDQFAKKSLDEWKPMVSSGRREICEAGELGLVVSLDGPVR